ncbi:MAG: hypothetical protein HZC05_03365 [Candidatus Magasanikbacteria bacterium]|nr:hypothetical protein [Candidatus Magasanikbacteria bacterium]
MFQTHEKKLIYITGGILAFFFLVSFLIIYPQYQSIQKMNNHILELRTSLELKYEKVRYLHKSQNILAQAKQITTELRSLFIKNGEEIGFISYLEGLADKFSIKQKINIARADKTKNRDIDKIDLQIDTQGEFVDLLSYLTALEHSDYLISISEVNLNRDASFLINMSLKAEVYVQN